MISLSDKYGRSFRTLRISLLNKCNFGCTYCTQGVEETNKADSTLEPTGLKSTGLKFDELVNLVYTLHKALDLKTIRLTGGEPLLYARLADLIKALNDMGIPEIKLTTNGFLLQRQAALLKRAGLKSVNVSLDAMEEDVFFLVNRRMHLHKVLEGIDAAQSEGLNVKINSVIMNGINHNQLIPLLEYAFEKGLIIRFLELMGMGHLHKNSEQYFFSQHEMLEIISMNHGIYRLPRATGSTANYWRTGAGQVFGIIANNSEPFCADCDRLRLDSNGNVYGCLSSNDPISILHANDQTLQKKLQQALNQKQSLRFQGSELSMLEIGG